MSRRLLVLRHAKSAWPAGVGDLERPLAPRGERDAAALGAFLARSGLVAQHCAASPALRTQATAQRVLAAAGAGDAVGVSVERELYDGDAVQVVRELPEEASIALIVGHEPEMVELVRTCCGADVRLPTCALAVIALEAPWALQPSGRGVLQALVTPKYLAGARSATV